MVIIIILIIMLFLFTLTREHFKPILRDMARLYPYQKENECCLVTKVFNKKDNKFEYNYRKLKNFNYKNFENNHEQHLFIHGQDGWDNRNCYKNNGIVGSCRKFNYECRDFYTKDECNKYSRDNMKWYDTTCMSEFCKLNKTCDAGVYCVKGSNKEKYIDRILKVDSRDIEFRVNR